MWGTVDIKNLIYHCKYQVALKIITKALEHKNTQTEEYITLLNYLINIYLKLGDSHTALETANQSINLGKQTNNQILIFDSFKSKIEVLLKTHDLTELDITFNQIEALTHDLSLFNFDQIDYVRAVVLHLKGAIERSKGNFSSAKTYYIESLRISSSFTDCELHAMTLNHLGINSEYLGENKEAIHYYDKALSLFKKIDYMYFVAGVSSNLGLIYRQMGELDKAITNFNRSSAIALELEDDTILARLNTNLGLAHIDLGNLRKAQEYLERGIESYKSIKFEGGLIVAYLNLGIIYSLRSEYNEAMQFYGLAADLAIKIDDKVNLVRVTHNIAQTYRTKGNYKLALLNFKKVLEIQKQFENSYVLGQIYYELVVTSTLSNDREDARLYLEGFKILINASSNNKLAVMYKLANATFLNFSDDVDTQLQAKKILKEIINLENLEYELFMEAIPKLCEILVKEYNWTKNKRIINEINNLLNKLTKLSSESPSYSVKVEVAILKSKTAFILEDPETSIQELKWAEDLTVKHDLEYLYERVAREKLSLERHILSMKQVTDKAATMLNLNKTIANEYLDYINKEFQPFSVDI